MNYKLAFPDFQKLVNKVYAKYTYPKSKLQNECVTSTSTPKTSGSSAKPLPKLPGRPSMKLSISQEFVSQYFTSCNPNGLFLYHSVGAGKTLSAVAIVNEFEKQGFNTLWITRTTLKKDLDKALDILPLRKPLMVLSYKQFSNVYKKKGENYKRLITRAQKLKPGTKDPLYKTILIIDEAHKLYTKDLKAQEMHDIKAIEKLIFCSHTLSKNFSVRTVLMSATPITRTPIEMIQLLNLVITKPEERFDVPNFEKDYLDSSGKMTKKGETEFLEKIKGIVSYLDASKNPNKFAQTEMENVYVPASGVGSVQDCEVEFVNCSKHFNEKTCSDAKKECNKNKKLFKKGNKETQLGLFSTSCKLDF